MVRGMRELLSLAAFAAGTLALSAGCSAGGAAESVRPKDPTAAGALDEAECHSVENGGEPLVVDWKPDQRGDLEVAMHDGVAVVAYSCQGLKLLKDCRIEGQYGFIGMTRKEQVVRLSNADEVRANLPLSGAQIGGEMQRGSTLDIAMIMVGKKRTTWSEPSKADLKGSCEGATHYVRGATVGAFVVEMGTEAKLRAAAELFGAGVDSGSSSQKQMRNKDGDPNDCSQASPDSDKPPAQCGAPIRLVLAPIAAAPAAEAAPEKPAPAAAASVEVACPAGLVMADGKCTSPAAAKSYECKPGDVAACTDQCDKGNAASCNHLGELYLLGSGVPADTAKARAPLEKGCSGDDARACLNLGLLLVQINSGAQAPKLFEKACDAGVAPGCGELGRAYLEGKLGLAADPNKALGLLEKACNGGAHRACGSAAALLAQGQGVTKDLPRAFALHQRACQGGVAESCSEVGRLHEVGVPGAPTSPMLAEFAYRSACFRGAAEACAELGRFEFERNPDGAKRDFQQACSRNVKFGCAALVTLYGEKHVVMPDVAQKNAAQQACLAGSTRDCVHVGLLDAATNSPVTAKMALDRACMKNDKVACAAVKKIK